MIKRRKELVESLREFIADANVVNFSCVKDTNFARKSKPLSLELQSSSLRSWEMPMRNRISKFFEALQLAGQRPHIASTFPSNRGKG